MIPIFQEYRPNYLKAWVLSPFNERYRLRNERRKFPEPLRTIAFEVLLTDDHKIALVKNSKAGCTTAAHVLYQYSKGTACTVDVHRPDIGMLQGEPHLRQALEALQDPNTLNITTVRHPIARATSAFTDFFLDKKNLRMDLHIDAIRAFGFDEGKTDAENFDVFLTYVEHCFSVNRDYTDRHFRPQVTNLAFSHVTYDKICRVETLNEDLTEVLRWVGQTEDQLKRFNLGARNSSKHDRYVPSAAQTDRLIGLYREDFEKLGYDPEIR